MELYRKVRLACAEGLSARAAAKHFGISRHGVKKMLSSSLPPGYSRTAVVKRPKLDGFTSVINQWLFVDEGRHRKQRHTAKRVFERLRDEHGLKGWLYDHQGLHARTGARWAGDLRAVEPSAWSCTG